MPNHSRRCSDEQSVAAQLYRGELRPEGVASAGDVGGLDLP
ncbi:MAG: hypothetical protein OEY60_16920 [Nitrospira sp.]|nr:hypothetical protein [Nitrospira sp.]MDH5727144.1 hypothetical protein [Nitrospira sp.]